MFSMLDSACAASEWGMFESVCELGVALLSPHTLDTACAVGRFLSEYLAAREILLSSQPFNTSMTPAVASSKWVGGRSSKLDEMRVHIGDTLNTRNVSVSPLPWTPCVITNTWINLHSREPIDDAFKHVSSWLCSEWERRLDKKSKPKVCSIACI